jgi:hypothetical protein
MKRPQSHIKTAHVRLMMLLSLLLALATGGLVLASSLASAVPLKAEPSQEAFDRVVPGMTRAEDLAGIGFDKPQILTATQAAARLNRIDRTVDACVAAQSWCAGYVFHDGKADAVLLVMDGRVVFKGIAA